MRLFRRLRLLRLLRLLSVVGVVSRCVPLTLTLSRGGERGSGFCQRDLVRGADEEEVAGFVAGEFDRRVFRHLRHTHLLRLGGDSQLQALE